MKKLISLYRKIPKRCRDSVSFSVFVLGLVSTFLSIAGVSLDTFGIGVFARFRITCLFFIGLTLVAYLFIGIINKFCTEIEIEIRGTKVLIKQGDIFEEPGLRVIGCDTSFDTRVDDVVICRNSLHGQFVAEHADETLFNMAIEENARRIGIERNEEGRYDFPLGTVIRYESDIDGHTYLLVAESELNDKLESCTNSAAFLHMLINMWREINRTYADHDVALPLIGSGIVRFDDGPRSAAELLKCILFALNWSGMTFQSKITILVYGDYKDIMLYEFRSLR